MPREVSKNQQVMNKEELTGNEEYALSETGKKEPYTVPNGYFDQLARRILSRVDDESETQVALPKIAMPYTVPQGYMEQLPQSVLQRVTEKKVEKKGTVLPMKLTRWAAAAMVIIMAGIGGYQMNSATHHNNLSTEGRALLGNVSEDEIKAYLIEEEQTNVGSANIEVTIGATNNDIKSYLDETGWEVE